MKRRAFLASLPAAIVVATSARSQQAPKVHRVGLLANTIPMEELTRKNSSNPLPRRLEEGLRKRGWQDGGNVRLIWRSAEGDLARLPALARELVDQRVDVLVAWGHGVPPAMHTTSSIPIVMGASGYRLGMGSTAPARNVTGLTLIPSDELIGKRLELLKEAAPRIRRVAFITDSPEAIDGATEGAAQRLGLSLVNVAFGRPDRLEATFQEAVGKGADGVIVPEGLYLHTSPVQSTIHRLAKRHRLPVLHYNLTAAETGGLLAYGPDILELHERVSHFIDRVLRGTRPDAIPIEQPSRVELRVNKRAAAAIGLTLPATLLARADRIIE